MLSNTRIPPVSLFKKLVSRQLSATICPRSSDPFHIITYYIENGSLLLDTQLVLISMDIYDVQTSKECLVNVQ